MKKILVIITLTFFIFQMMVLATAIDMGSPAINRGSTFPTNYTIIEKANPANEAGTITSVEIWANTNLSDVEVATFYYTGVFSRYTTRDTHFIGAVTSGSKQTFSGLSIDVQTGDYIGIFYYPGIMEIDTSGGTEMMYKAGDHIPCTDADFTSASGYLVSLYATGETITVGWDGPFNTKAITKWNTKEITKWNLIE